jgi:type IV pilus assembly protein PilC
MVNPVSEIAKKASQRSRLMEMLEGRKRILPRSVMRKDGEAPKVSKLAMFIGGRLSSKEKTYFAKRLSFLIRAGLPILDSLNIIRKQTKSKAKASIFDTLIVDVANGQFLFESLAKFKNVFGIFAVNIIRVGESSGVLSQNLNYLAEELKKRHAVKQKVVGALVYPIFITIATLGLTGLLTIFIFPKIQPIFDSLHVTVPLSTRVLIWASNFVRSWGLITGAVLVFIFGGVGILINKFDRVKIVFDRVLLHIPFTGTIIQTYNVTNICRTMGLLLKSGVTAVESLSVTAETTSNLIYRNEIKRAMEFVVRGERIGDSMSHKGSVFPDMVSDLITIGESTGDLSNTFMHLSEHFESELDELVKNLSSSIEPVLMITMGLLVGFVAVSVITPIYQITQNLHPK